MLRYYMPTLVLEDQEVVLKNKNLLKQYGQKALIVTGPHGSKVNGSLADMQQALTDTDIAYEVFDQVEANPSLENVIAGASCDLGVDFVIGIGGGSPLDAAKAIAVLLANPGKDPYTLLYEQPGAKALPVIAVPTTAGTGSETTPYAILTLHQDSTKRNFNQKVFPKIAFMDVRYFLTQPLTTRIHTCVDALSHMVESYLNKNATAYSDGMAEVGFNLWRMGYPGLSQSTIDEGQMQAFMQASTFGGMAIAQTGTSLPHGMGYPLTYYHGVDHGRANGLLMAAYMQVYENQSKVNRMVRLLGFDSLSDFRKAFTKVLEPVNLTQEQIQKYVEDMMTNTAKLKNYPYPVTKDLLIAIYTAATSPT